MRLAKPVPKANKANASRLNVRKVNASKANASRLNVRKVNASKVNASKVNVHKVKQVPEARKADQVALMRCRGV